MESCNFQHQAVAISNIGNHVNVGDINFAAAAQVPPAQSIPTQTQAQSQAAADEEDSDEEQVDNKCSHRSCVFRSKQGTIAKYKCWVSDCDKEIHYECYRGLVLARNKIAHFCTDDIDYLTAVVCGKKHHDNVFHSLCAVERSKEDLESKKWNESQKERDMEFNMKLLRNYEELRQKGWDDSFIVGMFPDMQKIIDCKIRSD